MINWQPINNAKRDGTRYLLLYPVETLPAQIAQGVSGQLIVEGYFDNDDDGCVWETPFGSIGEPIKFAEIEYDEKELARKALKSYIDKRLIETFTMFGCLKLDSMSQEELLATICFLANVNKFHSYKDRR